jgi:hypothetical protein
LYGSGNAVLCRLVSTVKWMGIVVALVLAAGTGATPASAAGAGPEATVRALVSAIRDGDKTRICARLDLHSFAPGKCGRLLSFEPAGRATFHVRSAFVRGRAARVLVDVTTLDQDSGVPTLSRSRVLLRRGAAGWRVIASGDLLNASYDLAGPADDPRPSGRAAALRRLADDELLALSNGRDAFLCDLLASNAPLRVQSSPACGPPRPVPGADDGLPQTLRLTGIGIHVTGPSRARLDITARASRAVASAQARAGWRVVSTVLHDTLRAVRSGGRWRLVKPSRAFYLAFGVPAPADVASPAPTATWPAPAVPPASVSELPVPAVCRVPPALAPTDLCRAIVSMALAAEPGGTALLAWSDGPPSGPHRTYARPLAAGAAAGPVRPVVPTGGDQAAGWAVLGLIATVDGGALLIEQRDSGDGARVTALDATGAVRGPTRTLLPVDAKGNTGAQVAASPSQASGASVLLDRGFPSPTVLLHVAADGSPVGPEVAVPTPGNAAAALPDGGVLMVGEFEDGMIKARRIGPDGSQLGPEVVVQRLLGNDRLLAPPAVAVDASGHALIAWQEEIGDGAVTTRAWAVDPSALGATAPTTIATEPRPSPTVADVRVAAASGGGWTAAWTQAAAGGRRSASALRLDADGHPLGAPVAVVPDVGSASDDFGGLELTGDTVAWLAPPEPAGLAQIRAAPLP